MPRFNVTMPQELWDRAGDVAPEGNRSWLIRRALEAALGNVSRADSASVGSGRSISTPATPASPRASVGKPAAVPVSRASELFRSTEPENGRACPGCDEAMAARVDPKAGALWVCPSCGTRVARSGEK